MMANNVRCTNANVWENGALRTCGWEGERFSGPAYYHATHPRAAVSPTAKPCPRCGGRIGLKSATPSADTGTSSTTN